MNSLLTTLDPERLAAHYRDGHWRPETLYRIVAAHAARAPDAVALADGRRTLTYGALLDAADRLAAHLRARGVRRGGRVAVFLPSRIETAAVLLAASRERFVCCPSLHRDHTVADVVDLLKRMRASALVAEPGWGADADRADLFSRLDGVPSLLATIGLAPAAETDPALPPFPACEGPAPAAPEGSPDTVVYLAFTSGTTGAPKGVMHSDNTLLANSRAITADWRMSARSVIYSLSPLSHNLGFGALVNALTVGGALVVHDLPRGASLVDRLAEVGATFLFGVPTHAIDLLAELDRRPGASLPALTGFRISGAPVPPETCAALIARGIVPQAGYGMTEACSHHYTLPDDDPDLITGSSGRACAGYEVRIFSRDDPDRPLAPGEIGQIGGRGASLMLGYFDDQEATESAFNRYGWFMTGDLGWMDEAGYLRITGRKKDVILRGGHNIYPARIEALAMRHDGIARAAALPVADERLGERVCLAVVAKDGAALSPEAVLGHLDAAGLSRYDMPEYFVQIPEMPLTSSGKILKRSLVDAIRAGEVTPQPVRFRPPARS